MKLQILHQYKSRKNCAQLIKTKEGVFVQKKRQQEEAYRRETLIYRMLQGSDLPCAELIWAGDQMLLMTQLPGRNLVEILEEQEKTGCIDWVVWDKLTDWFTAFWRLTGYVMTDVNLRNFLYDDSTKMLYGLDFEECMAEDPISAAARLAAYILHYAPEKTLVKMEIAEYVLRRFSLHLRADVQDLLTEAKKQEALLLARRKSRT